MKNITMQTDSKCDIKYVYYIDTSYNSNSNKVVIGQH